MLRSTLVALGASCCFACSAGGDTTREEHAFGDAAGRACQVTLEKSSPSAPSLSATVSCDGEGRQCSSEATSCFQLSVDDMSHRVLNCPACCRGTASSFISSDCSELRCQSDSDCVYARATCQDGACECPNGICE